MTHEDAQQLIKAIGDLASVVCYSGITLLFVLVYALGRITEAIGRATKGSSE